MTQKFSLAGRTALVTGCRRGIGAAITIALAEAGADIVGVSKNLEPGSSVEKTVRETGRGFTPYQCDMRHRDDVHALVDSLAFSHPRIDILVNNAGMISRSPALSHGEEAWDQTLEVNLTSQFILAQALGRGMIEVGSGRVIFIASLLSFQGGINVAAYAASKGAVAQLTKALANEWAASGVTVNALAPGYIATDNTEALRADLQRNEAILGRIPAGRWGEAADLGGPAVFLASDAAAYVNGTVLTVDGGWMGR